MESILIFGDTVRCPELRVEVPHSVADPFLYVERNGDRYTVVRSLEAARMSEIDGMTVLPLESLGLDEYVADGLDSDAAMLEIAARACRELGVDQATVPPAFPLELADRLRADGVALDVDRALFTARRRSKTPLQLEGIRRAQVAAEAGTAAAAELLRAAEPVGDILHFDGEPLTSERIKQDVAAAFLANGATAEDFIVAHGEQTCIGHHMGSGPIRVGEPITVDLWPRDVESGFYTDITRTFVVGRVSEELADYHRLCLEVHERVIPAIRPGVTGRELHTIASEVIEAGGYPTQLSKTPGEVLLDGFFHGLGHGVGLDVHEDPSLDLSGGELVAGDVVAVEPGCYRQGYGGVRLEDLVLVTEDGAEVLTSYPYALAP
ncbi:MAG TPA: Xaa-Pro peptidase family protein [Gaiella sp.]|nr:Xaa-Pro peptidase family protein [Gaiella sp.]